MNQFLDLDRREQQKREKNMGNAKTVKQHEENDRRDNGKREKEEEKKIEKKNFEKEEKIRKDRRLAHYYLSCLIFLKL